MERTDVEQWKAKEVARLLALVETERRYYQEMVASLPVALVVLSLDRSIVSSNRAFRQMFGVRTEDLRRKTIEQILDSPRLIEKIRDVHSSSTAQKDILVDFADRPLRVTVIPIRNWDDENETETLLMLEDTAGWTARPVEPGKAASGDIPAIVWQADLAAMKFISVGGAVETMLGYPVSHWLSTPRFFVDRIHPEDRATTIAFYEGAIERPGDASAEFRALTSTGRVVWCRETIRVIGRRLVSGVLTDITLRKQLEQQLLTAERSDALHGLSSRLAHDLNNPLMIVAGYGEEMLHSLKPEDPMRTDVQQILAATERISGITAQLLGYTRRLAVPPKRIDIAAAIAKMGSRIAQAAESRRGTRAGERSGLGYGRRGAIRRDDPGSGFAGSRGCQGPVARHDFLRRGKPRGAASRIDSAAGTYARVTVRDNGRATDASRQISTQCCPRNPSAAAIVRAYSTAREWGGDIAFSSSTFTIYLPQGDAPLPKAPRVAMPEEIPAPVEEPMRETILLVEDEAGIRALVRKILKRERYQVLEAGSGEEASGWPEPSTVASPSC